MAIEASRTGGGPINEIRDNDEYEAVLARVGALMDMKNQEARQERRALRAVIGRYRERELIWARVW